MHWERIGLVLMCTLGASAADDPLKAVLAKMDEAAANFKSLAANIKRVEHIEVLHEDNTDSGTIKVKRAKPKDLHVRLEIQGPNPLQAVVNGTDANVYYPNNPGEIQVIEMGHQKSLVDQFLTLGFGGNSRELLSAFTVKPGGPETVAGEKTTRLELTPKSKDMAQYKRIDLWISDTAGYTVQQKFFEAGGEYHVITYTNVQQNPGISDSVFKLDVPKGTKKEILIKK